MFDASPPIRRRGCQLPLSFLQLAVAAFYVCLTALTFVCIALCASPTSQAWLYPITATLSFVCVACYLVCCLSDVTEPGGIPCPCMSTQHLSQYDHNSGASIPGFDHFCVFMNVAVGKKTYFYFFMLALGGCLQFSWQVASLSAVAAGPWRAEGESPLSQTSKTVFAAVVAFLGVSGVVSFGSLCTFHS